MSDSCDWNLTIPSGPQHVGFYANFQTNCAVRACWLWDIYKDGRRKRSGSEVDSPTPGTPQAKQWPTC
jgi:hypothetical protein